MNLVAKFSSLTPNEKAMFLAHVAHEVTIFARASYVPTPEYPSRDFAHPDPIILRDANNFVHRVVGYIMHVLDGTEMKGQDEAVMEMIQDQFKEWNATHLLMKWINGETR